jgi:hypothetical protein
MLLRQDDREVLAIGQASHAWISGQLARAWGNDHFGRVHPWEEVCLAAEQHDVGMAAWDLEPTFNSDTGLPHGFTEMPLETHLELWTAGPRRLLSQSRYAALLVSMHGSRLYERRDLTTLSEADAAAVRSYLAHQREFQGQLLATLSAVPETVARNSDLIWTWDFLSLALCLGWPPTTAHDVPTADGAQEVRITAKNNRFCLDPWPFTAPSLTVRCEARRLPARFDSEAAMLDGLARASWETVEFDLVKAG